MWHVVIEHGDDKREQVSLEERRQILLGAKPPAEIILRGAGIQPVHMGILFRNGRFIAVAAKGVGLFKHNDKVVAKAELNSGDTLTLGQVVLHVVDGSRSELVDDLQELVDPLGAIDEAFDDLEPLDPLQDLEGLEELQELPTESQAGLDSEQHPLDDPIASESDPFSAADLDQVDLSVGQESPLADAPPAETKEKRPLLGPRTRRVFAEIGLALPFALVVALVNFWPQSEQSVIPLSEAIASQKWEKIAEHADEFLERYPRSPLRPQILGWKNVAKWKIQHESKSDSDSTQLVETMVRDFESPNAEYWEPAIQRPLVELFASVISSIVEQAEQQQRRRNYAKALTALEPVSEVVDLASRYLSDASKKSLELTRHQWDLVEFKRRLRRPEMQDEAEAAIAGAKGHEALSSALRAYDRLVSQYPDLRDLQSLATALRRVATAETKRVKVVTKSQTEPAKLAMPTVQNFVAGPSMETPDSQADSSVAFTIYNRSEGICYGLSMKGEVLWRRVVGFHPSGKCLIEANDGVWVCQTRPPGLAWIDSTGTTRWERALSNVPIDLLRFEKQIILLYSDGSIDFVDGATGVGQATMSLPLPVSAPAALDAVDGRLYVAADRAVVYELDLNDFRCVHCEYTGHEPGSLVGGPRVVGDSLVLVHRAESNQTRIRSWSRESWDSLALDVYSGIITQLSQPQANLCYGATADGQLVRITIENESIDVTASDLVDSLETTQLRIGRVSGELWLLGKPYRRLLWPPERQSPEIVFHSDSHSECIDGAFVRGSRAIVAMRYRAESGFALQSVGPNHDIQELGRFAERSAGDPILLPGGALTYLESGRGIWNKPNGETGRIVRGSEVWNDSQIVRSSGQTFRYNDQSTSLFGIAGSLNVWRRHQDQWQPIPLPSTASGVAVQRSGHLLVVLNDGQWLRLLPDGSSSILKVMDGEDEFGARTWLSVVPANESFILAATIDQDSNGTTVLLLRETENQIEIIEQKKLEYQLRHELVWDANQAWMADSKGTVYSLNQKTMEVVEQLATGDRIVFGPRRVGQRVLVGTSHRVWSYDRDQEKWLEFDKSVPQKSPWVGVAGDESCLVIIGRDGSLKIQDGDQAKTIQVYDSLSGNGALDSDALHLMSVDGTLLRIGRSVWEEADPPQKDESP